MSHRVGSVRFDKRRGTWNYLFYDHGTRRSKLIGTKKQYPSKLAAWKAVTPMEVKPAGHAPTVNTLVAFYRVEKMPKRVDTRRTYDSWLRNHVIPKWGECELSDVQARPVEMWLDSLALAPKSRAHIRGTLRILWDFAMWRGDVPTQRNPMELVTVKNASKRTRKPRSLTVDEFQKFVVHLGEPFRTIALLCVSFGLRISECLGLRWSDVDWLNGKLNVERAIVEQHVDECKTAGSCRSLHVTAEMLDTLKAWKQTSQFSGQEDWVFASPLHIGRLPWSRDHVWRAYQKAGAQAGIGGLGTHALRHTFRSWLDSVGTSLAVQQKLMRHASIVTTMDHYGEIVTDETRIASGKVAGLALNGAQTERKAS
jgi:integrase